MSTVIRKPKGELYDDDIHEMNYLSWIKEQVDRINEFSNIVEELHDEAQNKVITPNKLWTCASKFTSFYTTNIAFVAIYDKYKSIWQEKADKKYSEMYLDIKEKVHNKSHPIGKKYSGKAATMKEIGYEIMEREDYSEYKELLDKVDEFNRKMETQKKFVEALGRQDKILNMLQRGMETELKYLYIE